MLTRTTKNDALDRLEEIKRQQKHREWLSPLEVAKVLNYTRQWAWEKMKQFAESNGKKGGIPARRDPSRGNTKPYYVSHVHDLEKHIEDLWPEPHAR